MLQHHRILHSSSPSNVFLAHITCAGRAGILLPISLEGSRHSFKLGSVEVMPEYHQVGFALVSSVAGKRRGAELVRFLRWISR